MTSNKESVKLVNAALDEGEKGSIILRGVLAPETYNFLKIAPYQREILPTSKITNLVRAFENSSVPDIELGMRGGDFTEKGNAFYLEDNVYIIDGLQRVTAGRRLIQAQKIPHLGAVVHFNTTEEWERERFRILNTMRVKLSSNVLIRNMQDNYQIVNMLMTLCKDSSFVLANKICWNQKMIRSELITAMTLLRSSCNLHGRFGPLSATAYHELVPNLQKVYDKLGRNTLRENIRTFWEIMDECFKIRYTTISAGAPALRLGFLLTISQVLSDHNNFWDDTKLSVSSAFRKKISSFPINDPNVKPLATHNNLGGKNLLYQLLVNHINSGKRVNRLISSRKTILKKESA